MEVGKTVLIDFGRFKRLVGNHKSFKRNNLVSTYSVHYNNKKYILRLNASSMDVEGFKHGK